MNIQDMLPSNGKFKIFVFAGEYTRDEFLADLQQFADGLVDTLAKYGKTSHSEVMDIVTILSGKQDPACLLQVPSTLRPHWAQ